MQAPCWQEWFAAQSLLLVQDVGQVPPWQVKPFVHAVQQLVDAMQAEPHCLNDGVLQL